MAENYNYKAFVPENFMPQMRFDKSPELGKPGPDFPLWKIEDGTETSLHAVCASNVLTVVEFGSFT